ncbi:ATP-binding protein [Sorangium sp. So ce176]|uniref:ATP-binding protein n=1 Tax=Sorangium sp. So ce176 TaxID=3133286 RepID=UPI003F600EEB
MTTSRAPDYFAGLVRELCKLPNETEWVEFKANNANPIEIGEYISALSNTAALVGKVNAYIVWGVDDRSHDIIGTTFTPKREKRGNEELESWLLHGLTPKINFRFIDVLLDGKRVVLLEIARAFRHPVKFQNECYVRVGSYKKKLRDFPEKERELWRILDQTPFERGVAAERLSADEALRLLDYAAYFDLLERPLPDNKNGVLAALEQDDLLQRSDAGGWNVTNLGAILFAKKLDEFHGIRRKAMRVIVYKGKSRIETVKEQIGTKGYASGFEGLIGFVNGLVPANEVIGKALRKTVPMYPELAVRELVANALIHQDLFIAGAGPMVEIFEDRLEISNPGEPLIDTARFLDTPPKSRNEALASLMRRFRICEERGSGVDKVVFQTELYQLPAPLFEAPEDFTRAVLFASRPLAEMDKVDKVRACYLHACLKYVNRDYLTNSSLRERFGIDEKNRAIASRLIRDAVAERAIVPHDHDAAPKHMKYVPWWASTFSGADAALP